MSTFLRALPDWGKGRLSCFHGEKQPPIDDVTKYVKIASNIEKFYVAASERLPLKEMPDLVSCIYAGGLCFGLANPVSNIILNAIALLPLPPGEQQPRARRYLSLACHDLPVAIKLVHYDRLPPSSEKRCQLPDGGKMKAAFRAAALQARHPAPDVLAGFMTAQYPAGLLSPILAMVQSKKMLSQGDILDIRDLLAQQWPPNPPQVNISFRCTEPRRLLFSASLQEEGVVARCDRVIGRSKEQDGEMEVDYDAHPCEHILSLKMCLLDTIHAFYIKALARLPISARSARLLRALLMAGHCYGRMDLVSNIIFSTIWYDIAYGAEVECPQEIISTRHLSRLVSRSLDGLVAISRPTYKSEHEALYHINSSGCNVSSFLDAEDDESPSTQETACNNNTLFVDATKAAKHPQHAAFASFLMAMSKQKLTGVWSMLHTPGRRILDAEWDLLNQFVRSYVVPMSAQKDTKPPPRRLFSFASLEMFHPSASLASLGTFPPSDSLVMGQSASLFMSRETPSFRDSLTFVRKELNKLLHEYCCQHPWEPRCQLDIICGVMESSGSSYNDNSKLYHANFLVREYDDTLPQTEGKLFFAEFWGPEVVPLKQSSCRPINNHLYTEFRFLDDPEF
ncbi:hypothetical protein U9M48_027522, partial [Paspalum notatum var. saurae]